MSDLDIAAAPIKIFKPSRERLRKDLVHQVEDEESNVFADWSGWLIEDVDFVELTKEAQHELRRRYPEDERFASEDFHQVIMGGLTAEGAIFRRCNLDYLFFSHADFSNAVFDNCQQRGFFQSQFKLRNTMLVAPALTLDAGVIFHDLGVMKGISGEVFHAGDGRILHGVKFDPLRQIVYQPTIKDRWNNARQFLNAADEYGIFQRSTALFGASLSGLIGNLRARIVQGLCDRGYKVNVQEPKPGVGADKSRLPGPR
ncbi:MAG: pentapeptide repeat-containing protein [Micavibrio aeruginosavorus]|uniref:Pentapeptide repeat-containing protein n=1 Tax=Micavibrio aeruginosavorus TaxID=349221 RepID=A0A7T5R0I3_9BACT|nr:MAG: pentapeptide repeat-containing protein [Micavibrio aeruginosavorus]